MANNRYIFIIPCWLFLLEIYLGIASHTSEEARKILDENRLLPKTKGTIKTIECPENGDVIDCIDFWQQPAFDNPITKQLQLTNPTMGNATSSGMRNESKIPRRYHKWNKYGECPEGTVPIRRAKKYNDTMHRRKHRDGNFNDENEVHEHANVWYSTGTYHGSRAVLNVWKPNVVSTEGTDEMSLAQLWVLSQVGGRENLNSVEAGWQVYPRIFQSDEPRLFTFWTANNYQTGCYDVQEGCPGFVLTHRTITLGCDLDGTSIYGQDQYEMRLMMQRGRVDRRWYLLLNGDEIGYWPANLFTTLGDGANRLAWGGEVGYHRFGEEHTTTQMGSGHFPHEGFTRAAYFRDLRVINDNGDIGYFWEDVDTNLLTTYMVYNCYDLDIGEPGTSFLSHFFYGGPGGVDCDRAK